MPTKSLLLEVIRIDGGTQGRETINAEHVTDLALAIEQNKELPPLLVYFDGEEYWLADGFHRYYALLEQGVKGVQTEVVRGSRREAWLASLSANRAHGLRRTTADKRRLIISALQDEELRQWSDRRIAEHIGVSHTLVSSLRPGVPGACLALRIASDGRSVNRKQPSPATDGDCPFKPVPDLSSGGLDPATPAGSQGRGAEAGPCIKTGGEHEWEPDEDRPGHVVCKNCHDPDHDPDEPAVHPKRLFKRAGDGIGNLVRMIDEINAIFPNEGRREAVVEHLSKANAELLLWRKVGR